jgi:hypothetical protein
MWKAGSSGLHWCHHHHLWREEGCWGEVGLTVHELRMVREARGGGQQTCYVHSRE